MNLQLKKLQQQESLSREEMRELMLAMMQGELNDETIISILDALQKKGESIDEITAAATVMRELATPVVVSDPQAIDIVGTGGDNAGILNISTATAIVVAACGVTVAKHGNRSFSSKVGSADVLEAAGANLSLNPKQVEKMIADIQLGFLFAPLYHPAMRHVMSARKTYAKRSLFNLLGPLTNPANVKHYLLGVHSENLMLPFAHSLRKLGCAHAMVVYSQDGLDEISIAAPTEYAEVKNNLVSENAWIPEYVKLKRQSLDSLKVDTAEQSLAMINAAFANQASAARDMIIFNSGAALCAADKVENIIAGVNLAKQTIAEGKAAKKFQQFIDYTQQVAQTA